MIGDFNGDGRADLGVGVPNQECGTVADAGAMQVFYGTVASGLGASGNQIFQQGVGGILDACEANDHAGSQQ